jgi:hypothetical protein
MVDVYTIVKSVNGQVPAGIELPRLGEDNGDNIQRVVQPASVAALPNDAPKTDEALRLPAQVNIETTLRNNVGGNTTTIRNPTQQFGRNVMPLFASIRWDLDSADYNPALYAAQTFTVDGTVVLPRGVTNLNGVSLTVTVERTVNAGVPADYSAVDNAIGAAEALDRDIYVSFNDVDEAIAAVMRGMNINHQQDVDAFADAINNAIDSLVLIQLESITNAKFISIAGVNGRSNDTVRVLVFTVDKLYNNGFVDVVGYVVHIVGNNNNLDGRYVFGVDHALDGNTLVYDIRGNGSNIRDFRPPVWEEPIAD